MNMNAEHVIGLSALELGQACSGDVKKLARVAVAARSRYDQIRADGFLRPRGNAPDSLYDVGAIKALDVLAGDGKYIYLSHGARYRNPDMRPNSVTYGFFFDAVRLVEMGALVADDLLMPYGDIADEVAHEIAATLPARPLTKQDIEEFRALWGEDDQEVLAAIIESHDDNFWDILRGLEDQDLSVPGVEEAVVLFKQRAAELQTRERVGGAAALERLARGDEIEILFPYALPLTEAVAYVEAGEIIPIPRDEE